MKPSERIGELYEAKFREYAARCSETRWLLEAKIRDSVLGRVVVAYLDEEAEKNLKRAHLFAALAINAPHIGAPGLDEIRSHLEAAGMVQTAQSLSFADTPGGFASRAIAEAKELGLLP